MEIAKVEVAAVVKTLEEATDGQIVQLQELQLALIGGGIGEVIVA